MWAVLKPSSLVLYHEPRAHGDFNPPEHVIELGQRGFKRADAAEAVAILPGEETAVLAKQAKLFEEFIAEETEAGRFSPDFKPISRKKALLHGHCHQKAFAAMGAVEKTLRLVPELEVETVASSCCGMAGAFGYQEETYDISLQMAEASLLPAVRAESDDSYIVADGTSCRHQIKDGTAHNALHVARILDEALASR